MRTDIEDLIQHWTLECVSDIMQCAQQALLYFKLFALNEFRRNVCGDTVHKNAGGMRANVILKWE